VVAVSAKRESKDKRFVIPDAARVPDTTDVFAELVIRAVPDSRANFSISVAVSTPLAIGSATLTAEKLRSVAGLTNGLWPAPEGKEVEATPADPLPEIIVTVLAVALLAVIVKVSTAGFAAVTDSTKRVVTPLESFGVITKVAVSPAAMEPELALKENDAGAPATVHVTVVEAERAPGAEVSSLFCALSVHTE
jgi:hypothetical protein